MISWVTRSAPHRKRSSFRIGFSSSGHIQWATWNSAPTERSTHQPERAPTPITSISVRHRRLRQTLHQAIHPAEGGALRSQDLQTSSDPVGLDGTIIRIDPDTGAALPDNPLIASADANARRVVAYGLRNPFRFTIKPGTNELWIADVGWAEWEEINRLPNPLSSVVANFGWPCYEGPTAQPGYDAANIPICENPTRNRSWD